MLKHFPKHLTFIIWFYINFFTGLWCENSSSLLLIDLFGAKMRQLGRIDSHTDNLSCQKIKFRRQTKSKNGRCGKNNEILVEFCVKEVSDWNLRCQSFFWSINKKNFSRSVLTTAWFTVIIGLVFIEMKWNQRSSCVKYLQCGPLIIPNLHPGDRLLNSNSQSQPTSASLDMFRQHLPAAVTLSAAIRLHTPCGQLLTAVNRFFFSDHGCVAVLHLLVISGTCWWHFISCRLRVSSLTFCFVCLQLEFWTVYTGMKPWTCSMCIIKSIVTFCSPGFEWYLRNSWG